MIKVIRKDTEVHNNPNWSIELSNEDFTKFITDELMGHIIRAGIPSELATKVILMVFASKTPPMETPGFDEIIKFHPLLTSCIIAKYEHLRGLLDALEKKETKNEH